MSKNIIIQEGGTGKQLTASKLKTALVGGGSCLWVPEDETQLTTKHISEEGTYTAEAEGYYGFSEVTVSGVGVAVGYDPSGSGDEVSATTDPNTGNLVVKKLPSSILVDTPPTKLNYADGESIDFTGIIVKAYTASGMPWTDNVGHSNIIPFSELSFPVMAADASQVHQHGYTSDLDTSPVTQPISTSGGIYFISTKQSTGETKTEMSEYITGTGVIIVRETSDYWYFTGIAASAEQNGSSVTWETGDGRRTEAPANVAYTTGGKTVYYSYIYEDRVKKTAYWAGDTYNYAINGTYQSVDTLTGVYENAGKIAWTLIYGTPDPSGGLQEIPVEWNRPDDHQTLSAMFYISVGTSSNASMGEATGGGGYTVGGGAGRN